MYFETPLVVGSRGDLGDFDSAERSVFHPDNQESGVIRLDVNHHAGLCRALLVKHLRVGKHGEIFTEKMVHEVEYMGPKVKQHAATTKLLFLLPTDGLRGIDRTGVQIARPEGQDPAYFPSLMSSLARSAAGKKRYCSAIKAMTLCPERPLTTSIASREKSSVSQALSATPGSTSHMPTA